jgi:hypothetical protein
MSSLIVGVVSMEKFAINVVVASVAKQSRLLKALLICWIASRHAVLAAKGGSQRQLLCWILRLQSTPRINDDIACFKRTYYEIALSHLWKC